MMCRMEKGVQGLQSRTQIELSGKVNTRACVAREKASLGPVTRTVQTVITDDHLLLIGFPAYAILSSYYNGLVSREIL